MKSLFALALVLTASMASAADLPDPKDHEFNPNVPAVFAGEMRKVEAPGMAPFGVYASGPSDEPEAPAIILIHEWWGLNGHIKGVADQLGRLGYAAYAIDLYDGSVTDRAAKAQELSSTLAGDKAIIKLVSLVKDLKKRHGKVGVIGWCFGGGWSLQTAIHAPVDAAVVYYGALVDDPMVLKSVTAPILGIFAQKDGWITPARVDAFVRAAKLVEVKTTIFRYDADHAFANPSGERYDRAAARDAWGQTLKFLQGALGKK